LAPQAQGFFPQLEIARIRDGALQGVDQLGHGGEDRAFVVGQLADSGFCEPALDRFLSIRGCPFWNRGLPSPGEDTPETIRPK
jgi:hypothetical protein